MKLATFRVETSIGPFDRFGVVILNGGVNDTIINSRENKGIVLDVNFIFAAMENSKGIDNCNERANIFCPSNLAAFSSLYLNDFSSLDKLIDWISNNKDSRGPRGETLAWSLEDVSLMPPVSTVPVLRDFAAFEDHLENTFGKMGLKIPPAWYEQPTAFKGNPTTLFGHDVEVPWPRYTDKLDYELELAVIIGKPALNIEESKASEHIMGYTLLNDFSARDTQRGEMNVSTGPYKGKDFAWGLGPWVVTPGEFGDPADLKMAVRIDGEVWANSTPGPMKWTFPEAISYTSQDEPLQVGEVLGSGTVNNGCGFEIDRWIKPGSVVELEADRIGVLRHIVGSPEGKPIRWKRSEK